MASQDLFNRRTWNGIRVYPRLSLYLLALLGIYTTIFRILRIAVSLLLACFVFFRRRFSVREAHGLLSERGFAPSGGHDSGAQRASPADCRSSLTDGSLEFPTFVVRVFRWHIVNRHRLIAAKPFQQH